MKGRVKTRDLRKPRVLRRERFNELNLPRKMFRIEGTDSVQLRKQLRGDEVWLEETRPPVNDAVADGRDLFDSHSLVQPGNQLVNGGGLIDRSNAAVLRRVARLRNTPS